MHTCIEKGMVVKNIGDKVGMVLCIHFILHLMQSTGGSIGFVLLEE